MYTRNQSNLHKKLTKKTAHFMHDKLIVDVGKKTQSENFISFMNSRKEKTRLPIQQGLNHSNGRGESKLNSQSLQHYNFTLRENKCTGWVKS